MSKDSTIRLMSLAAKKKLAFLVLLYGRMTPELRSFCLDENRDFSIFQRAYEEFLRRLEGYDSSISWKQTREDILGATPDSEDFGTLEASFALNAALVAAEIAGFIDDAEDQHLIDAVGYARDSLDAIATNETGALISDRITEEYIRSYPLVEKEKQVEEDDVAFLLALQETPWSDATLALVSERLEHQEPLLNNHVRGL